MVYYIRFLKPPELDTRRGIARALVTVTTDLGESFYPGDLDLHAVVVAAKAEKHWQSAWQTIKWKSGMRIVWIEIRDMVSCPVESLHLAVNTQPTLMADKISLKEFPEILSAWSPCFGNKEKSIGNRVGRRYYTGTGVERKIDEEMHESIARHVW